MSIVEVAGLTRTFRQRQTWRTHRTVTAVDDMSFALEVGTATGYIGANGSGKSTTIKMLTGILTPTAGRVRVCGLDPVPDRRRLASHLGVLFGQRSLLWWDLPLQESYPILAAMHRRPPAVWRARLDALVEALELDDFLSRPVRNLSLGQRMRGELAAALLHEPELIVLDEPTIGLDLLSKEKLRQFLELEVRERGTTLLLTTHDMGDVQRLCERLIIIDHGRMIFDGTQPALHAHVGASKVLVVDVAESPVALALPEGATYERESDTRLRVSFDATRLTAATVLAQVQACCDVVDLAIEEPNIETLVTEILTSRHVPDTHC